MLRDFIRAVAQLGDPKLLKLLLFSLLLTVIAAVLLVNLTAWALTSIDVGGGGVFGVSVEGWALQFLLDSAAWALSILFALMLFPVVAISMQSLFLDAVASAVEARHYPGLPPSRQQSVGEIVVSALRLTLVMLGLNVVLLFVWLLLAITAAPLAPAPYYVVNSYLLGREYFEMTALRRMTPKAATALRKQKLGWNFADGLLLTILFTVPILNLIGPIIAAAYITHRFHRVWTPGAASSAVARAEDAEMPVP